MPLSTVAAKWRDAKAKKVKTAADKTAKTGTLDTNQGGGDGVSGPGPGPGPGPGDGDGGIGTGPGTAKNGGLMKLAMGGMPMYAVGGGLGALGSYSDGGRLLRGPGDGEFVIPARIVSELGNGSTEAGAKKLYAMMDRVQRARGKTTGKNKVAANSRADKYLPA